MKKLFIVVNVDWFFLSHRLPIALAAKEREYDVTIVTANTGKFEEIEAFGLKVIDFPMSRSGQNIFQEFNTCLFLYKLYRRKHPEIVHHVGLKTILWGSLAAKFANIKGVVNAVSGLGIIFSQEKKSILSGMLIRVFRFSHHRNNLKVIFQNNEDKSLFVDNHIINEDQVSMIKGSGVDLDQFQYTPEPVSGKITIIFTARMLVEKGVFVLIEAANKLKAKYKDYVQFWICGKIDDNPNAIKKHELELLCDGEYIQWLGYRTDVLHLLKQSHFVTFPSYYNEGLPKSLIEATAVGRPVITTNSVGCKDAVVDGYNGYLIPIKDSDTLSEKVSVLIDNKKIRVQMGINSRKLAETYFSIDTVIEKHLAIYDSLT